jgi:hypothetical protein
MIPKYRKIGLLIALALPIFLGSVSVQANLSSVFGPAATDLMKWGVFSLGGGINEADDFSGQTHICGDVGVDGNGNIKMSGSSTIDGDLYYHTGGTFTRTGSARVTGMIHHDMASDMVLGTTTTNANSIDMQANGMSDSMNYTVNGQPGPLTNVNGNQNITVMATAPGTNVVLKLTNFIRNGGTFTLSGSMTNNFIINVSKQFSLSGSSKIVLSGGVTWDNVLFNVHGTGTDVTLSGQSTMAGILMATKRTVNISGTVIIGQNQTGGPFGEVVGNKVVLSSGARVIHQVCSD